MNSAPVPNALFRAYYFRSVVLPTFSYLREAFLQKILPGFETVANEAEAMAEDKFQQLGQLPATDASDMGDLAEQAHEHGLAYYEGMTATRQSILNILAAALHHLHEQQFIEFYRRELLEHSHGEETDHNLLKVGRAVKHFRTMGSTARPISHLGQTLKSLN